MKKIIAMILALTALLAGCGGKEPVSTAQAPTQPALTAAPTEEPTTAPTTEPTTVPTTEPEPQFRHPLTGRELDGPMTDRVFGFSIGNTKESLPHYGVSKADLVFEAFANGLTTRRFAMFTDIGNIESVGGSRSMRVQFSDLALGYDAIALYAGGSPYVLGDLKKSGVDGIVSEQWGADFYYRDKDRMNNGYNYEHCLFVRGADLLNYAQSEGFRVTQDADKDYGLHFTENAMPADGEDAGIVNITFKLSNRSKPTIMTYHPEHGAYTMNQYDVDMVDGYYDNAPELYKNVFALTCTYHTEERIYHVPETVGEGEGYFACDGKIIPIQWHRADNNSPFTFTHMDGTPLEQGIGSSYIALIPTGSTVEWEAGDPAAVMAETEVQARAAEKVDAGAEAAAEADTAQQADSPEATIMEAEMADDTLLSEDAGG